MQNQKDKLNPSQQDYDEKFNRITAQPDMQALDDQGNAVAKDLQQAENVPKNQGVQSEKNGDDLAKAERSGYWKGSSVGGSGGRFSSWSTRKKGTVTGFVVAGLIGAIFTFSALLPLKVPGIMSLIGRETGQRVEQITEKRAKVIIARYLLHRYAPNSNFVITGDGPLSSLYASMRTAGFEKKLEAKGLVVTRTSDGVRLVHNGKELGGGQSLKNETAILRALESERLTNKMLRDVVREEVPAWRWMKRAKFAAWMRMKYGIPRYGLTNSDKQDSDEKLKEMDTERAKSATSRAKLLATTAISCIMGGSCKSGQVDVDGEGTPAKEAAANETEKIGETLDNVNTEIVEKAADGQLATIQESSTKLVMNKVGSKAIPIIGWIDLVATINHMVYHDAGKDDFLGKVAAEIKGQQYGWMFGVWSGYASQTQLGALDTEYVGKLAGELDGAETGEMYVATSGRTGAGKKVTDEQRVGSDGTSTISKVITGYIEKNDFAGTYRNFWNPLLEGYYNTIGGGGLLGWASDKIGLVIGKAVGLATPQAVEDVMAQTMQNLGAFIVKVVGLDVNLLAKGGELSNSLMVGGLVSHNDYCKEIGCRKLSKAASLEQTKTIATEREQTRQDNGIIYALFSPDESRSVTTQLATTTPSSVSGAGTQVASIFTSLPTQLASIISPNARAVPMATYESIAGVQAYGATTADLNKPLDENLAKGEECPEVEEGNYNGCTIDTEVTEALICEFDPESEGCADTIKVEGGNAGIRVASFNIFHQNPTWRERLARSVKVLKENNVDVAGLQEVRPDQNRLFSNERYGGDVYDIYPSEAKNQRFSANPIIWKKDRFDLVRTGGIPFTYFGNRKEDAPVVVLKDKLSGQEFYFVNTHDPAAVPRSGNPAATPGWRYENSLVYAKWFAEKKAEGKPMFFTGDFNSALVHWGSGASGTPGGDRNKLSYCILTEARTGLGHGYDLLKGRDGSCPSRTINWKDGLGGGSVVDHVYISRSVYKVVEYFRSERGVRNNGSDVHDTVIAGVCFTEADCSSDQGGNIAGWSWPLKKDINNGPCFGGPRGHAGMDMNSKTANNPVYAMHSGTVVQASASGGAAGNYVMIKADAKFDGKDVYYAYQHLRSGSITVKVGDKVGGGQKVGIAGTTGNVSLGSSKAHLHITMSHQATLGSYQNIGNMFDPMRILGPVKPAPGGYACTNS